MGTKMELTPEEVSMIQRMRKEAEDAKNRQYKPKLTGEYSEAEKIAAFEKLHALALNIWTRTANGEFLDGDERYWTYEAVIKLLSRGNDREMWDALNSYR